MQTICSCYQLFDLHARVELDPLGMHHEVDLPAGVLEGSPTQQADL